MIVNLSNWLSDFAFQIAFPWWSFLVSGILVLIIAIFTVSSQAIKAVLSNPVDAIRED